MAGVFLSYDHDDAAKARTIALALEKAGHSVWWDLHVRGGAQYSKVIEEALKASDAVVVLWSARSVESAWVRDEAATGRDSGRLVPVGLDGTPPPLGFRQYQTIDLSRWNSRSRNGQFQVLLAAIDSLAAGHGPVVPKEASRVPSKAERSLRRPAMIALAAIFAVALLSAFVIWRPWAGRSSTPVVAVSPASHSEPARRLAGDLLTKLGTLNSMQIEAFSLVQGGDDGAKPDFVFQVDGTTQGPAAKANLVFLGKENSLLWSKAFEQPSGRQGDLTQQLAITAAKVLDCALEAHSPNGQRLDQDTIKLYLNGCSAHSTMMGDEDSRGLIPLFRQVVAKAPHFEPGWAKLLYVEGDVVFSGLSGEAEQMRAAMVGHMGEARKLNPNMPALLLAEADMAPQQDYIKRMALLRKAVDRNADSSEAYAAYSSYLFKVGRAFDALDAAKMAVRLDPLSPSARDALITALTYTGQIEPALAELRKAEALWPGARNLLGARYRLHLRYGDPREALRIQQSGNYGGEHRVAFLRARIDPTEENIETAVSHPRRWLRQHPEAIVELIQILGAFDREEELFPLLLNWNHPDKTDWIADVLFRPSARPIHRDPRMIAVAKRLGLLDYWRQSGKWPDFCMDPKLPYDCQQEAAKLAA